MHGITIDATIFFINSPYLWSNNSKCGDNLAFCLLKDGRYDLWLGNSRGNGWSMRHLHYTEKDKRFWRFSWDHMAEYDLPAFIDYIRNRTRHQTIGYLGFSQGATQMWALLTLRPEYAAIIRPFVNWAPAVFMGRSTSLFGEPMRRFWPLVMTPGRFHPSDNELVNSLEQLYTCRTEEGARYCARLFDPIFGSSNVNVTRIPAYDKWGGPRSCSNWQVAHFGQNGQSGRFRRFDYRSVAANLLAYGQKTVPEYQFERIPRAFKTVIIYGASDAIVVPADVHQLIRVLRTVGLHVTEHLVSSSTWSHLDFVLGIDTGRLVNDHTLSYFDMYTVNDHPSALVKNNKSEIN